MAVERITAAEYRALQRQPVKAKRASTKEVLRSDTPTEFRCVACDARFRALSSAAVERHVIEAHSGGRFEVVL